MIIGTHTDTPTTLSHDHTHALLVYQTDTRTYHSVCDGAVFVEDFFKDSEIHQLRVVEITREWSLNSNTVHSTHTAGGGQGGQISISVHTHGRGALLIYMKCKHKESENLELYTSKLC